jgi:ATP-dependent Zn protease
VLDPAILRPGRFDRRIVVNRPDVRGRDGILRVHTKKVPLGPDVDLEILARGTPGMVGADVENLVNEAALLAARQDKDMVTMSDFEMAKDKVLMGAERRHGDQRPGEATTAGTSPVTVAGYLLRTTTRSTRSRSSRAAARSASRSSCHRKTGST